MFDRLKRTLDDINRQNNPRTETRNIENNNIQNNTQQESRTRRTNSITTEERESTVAEPALLFYKQLTSMSINEEPQLEQNISSGFVLLVHECASLQPIHKTEYDDIYIIYKYGFDMHTGQKINRKKDKYEEEKFIKIKPMSITSEHTQYEDNTPWIHPYWR